MANDTLITICGNLTADPELNHNRDGLAVVNLTIASTPRTFDRQANDWVDGDTLFLRASAWREFAENIAASLVKGSRVLAEGKLVQRSYETKEGEKRTSIELQLEAIGPDLRMATAQVTRQGSATTSRNNETRRQQQAPPAQRQAEEPKTYAPGQATAEVAAAKEQAAKAQESWLDPTYQDEVPF